MDLTKKKIFVLTGAGISRESGIKTFREHDGLWENYKIEDVCTIEAFFKNKDYVNNFYNQRRKDLNNPKIKPNNAHKYLAILEKSCQKFMLVTQNVDNLHERSGSQKVFHMHGTLNKAFCMDCNFNFDLNFDLSSSYICTNCKSFGNVRVDVVWFGEQPKYLKKIYSFLGDIDIFISIGTSNNVYPAAGFIDYTKQFNNKKTEFIEFNLEKTNKSQHFDKTFIGPASITVERFVKKELKID